MFIIETIFSVFTLLAMLLMSNRHHLAPALGVTVNFCWVVLWIYTGQYGFLFLDVGILLIYVRTAKKQLKGEW